MATVISLFDDEGQHIKTFISQPKPKRRIVDPWGLFAGLVLLILMINHGLL